MTDDVLDDEPATPDLPAVRDIFSAPSHRSTGGTYLRPTDSFPDLTVLSLQDLQVLHSRLARQREWEFLTIDGPDPYTLDRLNEVTEALDARDPAGP